MEQGGKHLAQCRYSLDDVRHGRAGSSGGTAVLGFKLQEVTSQATDIRFARAARLVWAVLAASGTLLFAIGPISQWGQLATACHSVSSCAPFQVDTRTSRLLAQHGVSLTEYALYVALVLGIVWLVWYGISALIVWRKPADRGALVSSFFLLLFPLLTIALLVPSITGLAVVAIVALILFALLFPDGQFTPRWTRWLGAGAIVSVSTLFIPAVSAGSGPLWMVPIVLVPLSLVGVQIYRFRRVSSWRERQQTKWVFLGTIVGIVTPIIVILFLGSMGGGNGTAYGAMVTLAITVAPSAIPLASFS